MNITLDLSPAVHRHAGLGRYASELLTALLAVAPEHAYSAVYYAPQGAERPAPPLDRLPAQTLHLGPKPWRMSVLLADYLGVNMDRWVHAGEVFHATDHLLPRFKRSRTVFTIHDLIYLFYPQYHLPLNRWYLKLMLPRFLRRADAVIAVSEHTRRDVMRHMRIPEEKITVIYEGANPAYRPLRDPAAVAAVRARYHLPERYLLFFSTIEPRKNLAALLGAYHALLAQPGDWPHLVVAGRKGWLYEPIFARVRELGLEARVTFTDWVAEADAPALLNGAELFVYPSFYEGFGLPPLEAMACGVPVVASTAASIPEIVGDAGLLVPPTDEAALMEAMQAALTDAQLRTHMRARGLARARTFTWEAAARATLKVYAQVIEQRGRHAHRV
ncbi:MAG: glycosyltransferase family 4 protein [Anaerolineales bacterium]|nr:glycosyltransferase family 4 protein [Anaerolineales bacterium]